MNGHKQTSILKHFASENSTMPTHSTPKQIENKHVHVKDARSTTQDVSGSARKTLKTIQLTKQEDSLTRDGTPISSKAKSGLKSLRFHTCKSPISIYKDPAPLTASDPSLDESTQTDTEKCWCACHEEKKVELSAEEEADLLMVNPVNPERTETYWREYSETQREALSETLEENEELEKTLMQLTEENKRLYELSVQGGKLADFFLEYCMSENEGESDNKD